MPMALTEAPHATDTIEIRAIVAVLRRQNRVMLYSAALVFGLAALFLSLATPKYTATSLLIVDPLGKNVLEAGQRTTPSAATDSAKIDSEVEILRSDAISLGVINKMALGADAEFRPPAPLAERLAQFAGRANAANSSEIATARTLRRFQGHIDIGRRGLTYVIAVSATSRNPGRARDVANTLAETYIGRQVDGKIAASLAGRDVLLGQIIAAQARMASSEDRFDEFLRTHIEALGPDGSEPFASLARALNQNLQDQSRRAGLADAMKVSIASGEWSKVAGLVRDNELAVLAADRNAIRGGLNAEAELRAIDGLLAQKAAGLLRGLDHEVARLDQKAAGLRTRRRQTLPIGDLTPEQLTELYAIQQEADIARNQYQTLLARVRDLETQAALQIANARVISPAITPVVPSFPNRTLVLLLAIASAAGLGVSMAFLNEYFIGGVTSESQLAEVLRVPEAVAIPQTDETNSGRTSPADRVVDEPLSSYAEAYRKLKAAIDQGLRGKPKDTSDGHIILVSSALANEGKTTTALALARSFAVAGRKTLLIDADLRQPSLHNHLGFEPEGGFGEYLRDPEASSGMRDFYARDPSSPLAMILGHTRSATATDQLLTGPAFARIIKQAREVYDVTIIDTPPILPVVDAAYVAESADAVVLAVKWATTS